MLIDSYLSIDSSFVNRIPCRPPLAGAIGQAPRGRPASAVCSRIARTTGSQSARSTPCPAPSSVSRVAPGISAASARPCASGNIRIGGAMDRERRRLDRRDRRRGRTSPSGIAPWFSDDAMSRARTTSRWTSFAPGRLVERALASRQHARVADEVLDHRLLVRPVHVGRGQEAGEALSRRGRLPVGGRPRLPGDVLTRTSDRTRSGCASASSWAKAPPAETPTTWAAGIPYASRTPAASDQVGAGVRRVPRLVGHRSAGVAVVVADDEAAALGQHPAEALLPPEHRRADAHHQEDGRVARIAERLRAELDAVRLDHPLHRYQPA